MYDTRTFAVVTFAVVTSCLAVHSKAAETSVVSSVSGGYRYDDNVNTAPTNKISLSGAQADGSVELRYATPRWSSGTQLKAGVERYENLDFDSDNSLLQKPHASDFNNETYNVGGDTSYSWEHNTASLYGGYSRDNTTDSQFTSSTIGGLQQIEGVTYQNTVFIQPGWHSELTERQVFEGGVNVQSVDFDSERYVDYDYLSTQFTWSYILNERLRLQARPQYSRFENKANFAITSDTYGLEGGILWLINEKWTLDALAGATQVSSQYDPDSYLIFNPITGQIQLVELEAADSNGVTGSIDLSFKGENHGFSANIDADYSPSANGYLQQNTQGSLNFYWQPNERFRFNFSSQIGYTDTSGDTYENKINYGEAEFRAAYQLGEDWWLIGRYRYREQENKSFDFGKGRGNLVTAEMSYHLPKEIL